MRLADVRIEVIENIVVGRLDGELDMSNAEEVAAAIHDRMTNDALGLVVDLTGLSYIDSAGINVLFSLRENLTKRGQRMRLVVPPGSVVSDTLEIAGVSRAIGVVDSMEKGLAEIADRGH